MSMSIYLYPSALLRLFFFLISFLYSFSFKTITLWLSVMHLDHIYRSQVDVLFICTHSVYIFHFKRDVHGLHRNLCENFYISVIIVMSLLFEYFIITIFSLLAIFACAWFVRKWINIVDFSYWKAAAFRPTIGG